MSDPRPEQRVEGRMATPAGQRSLPELRLPPRVPDHELVRRIGGGSYGDVWLARSVLGVYRAVKVVYRTDFENDHPFEREFAGIKRFEPISRLHESQVDILHVGRASDCFYYVMELADDAGELPQPEDRGGMREEGNNHPQTSVIDPERYVPKTLRTELKRRGKLPLEECLETALTLATALDHLHSHNLVHRDIKPSNIIFINGTPRLADIGLVTGVDATRSYVGTEGYIPPEGAGTPQADLYSLGKVLYEMGTGMDRQNFPEPPTFWEESPAESAWLEFHEVLLRACETDPRRRYQSAADLRAELELLHAGKSVRRLRTVERRLALLTRFGLATSILLVVAAGAYLFSVHEAHQARQEAQRADREAARARLAEGQARERLYESYLALAQARRWSGRMGRRFESLDALRKAAEIRPSIKLRNEAFACLALSDIGPGKEWEANIPGTVLLALDSTFTRYARADAQGNISIRRVHDDQEVLHLPGAGNLPEVNMAFSPDDQLLAVFSRVNETHELLVWDLARQELKLKPSGINGRIFTFAPDSRSLALAQHQGPILVYDLASGLPVQSFEEHELPYCMTFSPGGEQLAVCSDLSRSVYIHDLKTGRVLQSLTHSNGVRSVVWEPAGALLATACADHRIYIWNALDGSLRRTLAGHQGAVTGLNYNPRGDLLLSSAWDSTIRLWDPLNAHLLLVASADGGGGFSADGRWLAYSPSGTNIRICEVADGTECRCLRFDVTPGVARSCDFNSDGTRLVSAHSDGAHIWDVAGRKELALVPEKDLQCARFQPGGLLFTAGRWGLKKWPATGSAGGELPFGSPALFGNSPLPVSAFSCSQDGQTIGCIQDEKALLFNAHTGDLKLQLSGDTPLLAVVLSPDAKWVAGADNRQALVRVWDLEETNRVKDLPCAGANNVAFSPDSKWLLTSGWSDYQFWATGAWQGGHKIPRSGTGGLHGRAAFAPDSRMVAVTDSAQSVRLVEVQTGQERAAFEMPEPQVICGLAFSPDGDQLAVCGQTPVIYLWNLRLIRQQLAAMKLDW